MERAAEVKLSARCSEEPVAGDGSMCAVSITERAKLDEPEAADGITGRSPKPLAVDGVGITKKRPRKPEEPPKKEKGAKEKGAEEKIKRSKKKRAVEKNKQPNNVEVVHEKIMTEAEEKRNRSNQEKRIEEMLMRIEKIASKVEEQVARDGMKKEKRTKKPEDNDAMGEVADNEAIREIMADNEAGGMTKKKVVTWRLSQELLDYLRTKEVMGLLATEAPLLPWANKMAGALFDFNQRLKEEIAVEFQKNREFDAHVLYQYRTHGYAEIKEEVSDEEDDV